MDTSCEVKKKEIRLSRNDEKLQLVMVGKTVKVDFPGPHDGKKIVSEHFYLTSLKLQFVINKEFCTVRIRVSINYA